MVNPAKIAGIVHSDEYDETGSFAAPDAVTSRIGENVADFLGAEVVDAVGASLAP
jgi:acetyl-CoA hydrolase